MVAFVSRCGAAHSSGITGRPVPPDPSRSREANPSTRCQANSVWCRCWRPGAVADLGVSDNAAYLHQDAGAQQRHHAQPRPATSATHTRTMEATTAA
jgi:hypothetical protein